MHFEMKQRQYIVCPKCKNDTSFDCIGDRIDYGIFEIKIACRKCDWISDELYEETGYSDELYEETGYFPDLSLESIRYHVKTLHDMQQEEKQGG